MDIISQKIAKKSDKNPIECSCNTCRQMCKNAPCLGTPQDILRLCEAGYSEKIMPTLWGAGLVLGFIDFTIDMYQQIEVKNHGCIFLKDGLCELHDKGLKPTDGVLSNCKSSQYFENSTSWLVAKEWIEPKNRFIISQIKRYIEANVKTIEL